MEGDRDTLDADRVQSRALCLEKCVVWTQSGKAAWVRRHVNWAEREEQNLDGLSGGGDSIPGKGNGTSKSMEAGR